MGRTLRLTYRLMFNYFNNWVDWTASILYIVTILSSIVVILSENRNPIRSLAWILALIFLPVVGFIFYLFFGRSLKGQHMISKNGKRRLLGSVELPHVDLRDQPLSPDDKHLVKLARNISNSFYTVNNKISVFTNGARKFEALKEDMQNAKKSIYLQYYIFSDDSLGQEIADILCQKAREGLEVRVIYDHVGSFSVKNEFFKRMKAAGVDTHPFFKVTFPQLANRINWRNHRKIVVIDSKVGYIGGMNIADRYQRGLSHGQSWRDTHFRLEGDIVESLILSFMIDWNFRNQPDLMKCPEIPHHSIRNNVGMQLVTSGPIDQYDNLALCFLKAIGSAKKSIYVQTPYFLPTDTLLHALEAAALSNIDVRIMMPRKSDSRTLQYANFSYVTQCLKAGIKIYLYEPGMLHAKMMIIDEDFVTSGSTNFDFRSFENNFESNLLIYDKEINAKMRDIFFEDMKKCTKVTYSKWHSRPRIQRSLESLIRLLAPIL